jgi:hypothetical protein
MKRFVFVALLALVAPIAAIAAGPATLGLFFDQYVPSQMSYEPQVETTFKAYLYLINNPANVTAIEYQLSVQGAGSVFIIDKFTMRDNSIWLGDPLAGQAVAFWPPLDSCPPGFKLVGTFDCVITEPCASQGGSLVDYQIVVGPHPESGELRGTVYPDNDFFPIVGMTSLLCPGLIGTKESSWGAIKSLYQ